MGRKVHPIGFRLKVTKTWDARWFAEGEEYVDHLQEDLMIRKLIQSAIANAENNFGLNRYDLYIHNIIADEGPTRRWRRFGARGRVKPRLRRSSHISVVLREHEGA